MTPAEKQFVDYWSEKRKDWSWSRHSKKIFFKIAVPLVILIDLVNYFIIGDTDFDFISFMHLWVIIRNTVLISVLLILATGVTDWNFNETKYWRIKRKYFNKLQ